MLAYSMNQAVDAIQTAKKSWVSKWVQDAPLATHLNKFVDTQTEYTKSMLSNFETVAFGMVGYSVGKTQEAAKKTVELAKQFTTKA